MSSIAYLANIFLIFFACSGAPQQMQQMQEITYSNPKHAFEMKQASLVSNNVMVIDVVEVKNPEKLPVTLQAAFTDASNRWPVGEFTLYPADRPGKFPFRIPDAVNKIKNSKNLKVEIALNTDQLHGMKTGNLSIKIAEPTLQR